MTLTDEPKILDNKIKANQAQYDLARKAGKISALSAKDPLEKYEYLTGEDLGYRPSVLEKAKIEYSPLGVSLSKSFKKDNGKKISNRVSDFNYDSKYKFYRFYKQDDEFEEMSLDSQHNKIKEFERILNNFKNLKPLKQETQLKKERIMKNVDELYKKYYNFYKNDFDNDDELSEAKKKKFDYKQFELIDRTDKELMLPNWVEINKKRFNQILSTVTKAKNKGLRINVDGREITLDNKDSLLKDFGNGILNRHEFKNGYNNIVDDIEAIVNKPKITRNQ